MKTRRRQDKSFTNFFLKGIILFSFFVFHDVYSQENKSPESLNYEDVKKMMIYPEKAYEAEGKVGIILGIDTNGNVIEMGALTGPEVFYDEVRRVSMYLNFTPAIINNVKVNSWVTMYYIFKIK